MFPPPVSYIDPLSFWLGFLAASIFWWLVSKMRPLLAQLRRDIRERRETAQARTTSSVEEHHRRATLRLAQGMHLAAPLFSLDEILQTPKLMAPPPRVEPGAPLFSEDITSQTLPYLPAWPELASTYNTATLTIPQALSGGVNLVIIGQPGSGKTVALAHLASLAANRDPQLGELSDYVPFIVHVADVSLPVTNPNDILKSIIDAAAERLPVFDLPRLPGFAQHAFRSGRALLLIDGYDELSPDGMQQTAAYLDMLLKAFPRTRIAITGCPEHLDGLINLGFAPLALMTWGAQQREHFLRQWSELWTRYVAVEAWAQTGPGQVDPLLLNCWLTADNTILTPLELTLKTWTLYAGDGRGPRPLDAVETHLLRLAPAGVPLAALEMLALQVSLTAQPIFDPRKAREWIKSFEPPEEKTDEEERGKRKEKASATAGLLAKLTESGLLIAHRENAMRFVHPVFGGYLAGRALSDHAAAETLLKQPAWSGKTLTMHYLAAQGDASPLAEALLEESDPPLERNLLMTARWLRDAPRQASWRGKVLSRLATLLQTEGLPLGLRGQALAAFVLSDDAGVAALFRQFLQTQSPDVMRLAALGCGMMQDAKAVEHLTPLFQVPNTYTRRAACLALVAIGSTPALEAVATSLLGGDEDLRRAAAEALANHPGEGHAMLKDGTTMADILVRRAVAFGLARIDQPWAAAELEKLQVEDEQWVVRNAAAEILESKQQSNPYVPRRLPPPSESPWLIAFASTQGMGISPGAPATDMLLLALKSDNEEERLAALPYLRRTPSEGVLGGLYHAMYSGDTELREAVFQTLWEIAAGGMELPLPQSFGVG